MREGSPKERDILMHLPLAGLFLGMIGGVVIPAVWLPGNVQAGYIIMALVLAVALAVSEWMKLDGAWRPPLNVFGLVVCVATLAGLPGLFTHASGQLASGLMFFGVLGVRNYLCLISYPRTGRVWRAAAGREVIVWLLCASLVIMLGSLRFAWASDVSVSSTVRLTGEGNNWLNANTAGVYTASGIIAAVMGRFLRWWLRLGFCVLGLYVLLLTQSRTAMLALAVAWLTNAAVLLYQHRMRRLWIAALACALGVLILPAVIEPVTQVGQVDALLRRSQGPSVLSGRAELIDAAVARIADSPAFGFGFMSEESRFENGYLSWALETGLVGLSAYVALIGIVLARALKLLAQRHNPASQDLARYALVLTAFVLSHAMGERTHAFQVAFVTSNAWAVVAGMVFVQSSRRALRALPAPWPAYHLTESRACSERITEDRASA